MNRPAKTLKDALYTTIHNNKLSIEAIADPLNMAPSYLYRAALPDPDTDGPNASGVRFPLRQLVPLIRITGDCGVLDLIEFQLGRVAIPIPKHHHDPADIQTKAIESVVKIGKLVKGIRDSISDGKISAKEQVLIEKEGREAIQSIMALIQEA
jgi:hypothetical protein